MIFNVNFKTLSSLIKSAFVGVWNLLKSGLALFSGCVYDYVQRSQHIIIHSTYHPLALLSRLLYICMLEMHNSNVRSLVFLCVPCGYRSDVSFIQFRVFFLTDLQHVGICLINSCLWFLQQQIVIYFYFIHLFFFWRDSPPPDPVGQGHLIHEVSRSHTLTHHSR